MVKVSKAVCILSTATAALFVLGNVLAAYVYQPDTRAIVSGHPVFNEATRAAYEKIHQLPINVVREIVDQCWTESAWIVEPAFSFASAHGPASSSTSHSTASMRRGKGCDKERRSWAPGRHD